MRNLFSLGLLVFPLLFLSGCLATSGSETGQSSVSDEKRQTSLVGAPEEINEVKSTLLLNFTEYVRTLVGKSSTDPGFEGALDFNKDQMISTLDLSRIKAFPKAEPLSVVSGIEEAIRIRIGQTAPSGSIFDVNQDGVISVLDRAQVKKELLNLCGVDCVVKEEEEDKEDKTQSAILEDFIEHTRQLVGKKQGDEEYDSSFDFNGDRVISTLDLVRIKAFPKVEPKSVSAGLQEAVRLRVGQGDTAPFDINGDGLVTAVDRAKLKSEILLICGDICR